LKPTPADAPVRAAFISFALLVALAGWPSSVSAVDTQAQQDQRIRALSRQVQSTSKRTATLTKEADKTWTIVEFILAPIGALVGILALGGALGIVFSIRDQRRVSQLHELTVGSEVSSQRRDEQSYSSFLEQSQTTLALVNDTLKLAKEATDRAAHSTEIKAQARVQEIEDRAQQLMLEVFSTGEFELIIDDPGRRSELHSIAAELRSIEGYLSLQDIELPPYTKFIKAVDQFLLDDTEAALHALRRSSQDRVVSDLHRFSLYWLGYMLTTVSEYEEAISRFRDDEVDLPDDHSERLQLERIIEETEFFKVAKPRVDTASVRNYEDGRSPQERYLAVAKLLDRLTKLAADVERSEDARAKTHTSLEVARTRADVFAWIAHDPEHLDDPLESEAIGRARPLGVWPGSAEAFPTSDGWGVIAEPNAFRAWALFQAQAICVAPKPPNFYVAFALAECYFKLRDEGADTAFENAEHRLNDEFGEFREKRRHASLQQAALICHSRLLKLREGSDTLRKSETRHVQEAARKAREAVSEMRQRRVTIFSQIQRRNVTQDEFKAEVNSIIEQDHLKPEDMT
jgi:tetratricopeptide (TPR) repeat protein